MKATLSDLILDCDGDPEAFSGDASRFGFLIQALVGAEPDGGGESFDFIVCSPEWLMRRCESEGFVAGYHHLVVRVQDYSNEKLRQFVEGWVSSVEGLDWQTIADKLRMLGAWEFEDYRP
jgi:hypothetical protein